MHPIFYKFENKKRHTKTVALFQLTPTKNIGSYYLLIYEKKLFQTNYIPGSGKRLFLQVSFPYHLSGFAGLGADNDTAEYYA